MNISFYLQNSSDDVDVWIIDRNRQRIRQIGRNVFMRARPPKRHPFSWDGRLANGSVAPAGVYYIQVYLLHQARSLIISNHTAALPVTVETTRPQVRVTGVTPATIATAGPDTGDDPLHRHGHGETADPHRPCHRRRRATGQELRRDDQVGHEHLGRDPRRRQARAARDLRGQRPGDGQGLHHVELAVHTGGRAARRGHCELVGAT